MKRQGKDADPLKADRWHEDARECTVALLRAIPWAVWRDDPDIWVGFAARVADALELEHRKRFTR